jgi:hypothetical protein
MSKVQLRYMNQKIKDMLAGGDLRSIGEVEQVIRLVNSQSEFDELFEFLASPERLVAMRAADAIEKITQRHPAYLTKHKAEILALINQPQHIELKWHLAQLIGRIKLDAHEFKIVWNILNQWVLDKMESRIVRVNSLQALHDLLPQCPEFSGNFEQSMEALKQEGVPSISARIKKLYGLVLSKQKLK